VTVSRALEAHVWPRHTHYTSYAKLRLHTKAATQINMIARGRLARRRAATERHLLVIKNARELLLQYALKFGANAAGVFWYERDEVRFMYG
jgi:hypothetical protein